MLHRTPLIRMPFKKSTNNKKNKTKKQKKPVTDSATQNADTNDASSVEEISLIEPPPILTEAPLEEIKNEETIMDPVEYEDYMMKNYYIPAREEAIKRWKDAEIEMVNDPDYWNDQLDVLERQRSRYHKKGAWSAADIKEIDEIDEKIKNVEAILDRFYDIEPEEPKLNAILGNDWAKAEDNHGWISSH
jgi:hypothetical protein